MNKARRAFFGLGSLGIYHGKQNPLTASEVVQVSVMPVCLYGSENWLLTDPLLLTLESLQAEIGKRILNLPKSMPSHFSSLAYHILIRKLSFLYQIVNSHQSTINIQVFNSLRHEASGPLIVQQCKFLEEVYDTNVTESILEGDEMCFKSQETLRVAILTMFGNSLALSSDISWPKLWDMAQQECLRFEISLSHYKSPDKTDAGKQSILETLLLPTTLQQYICHKHSLIFFPFS